MPRPRSLAGTGLLLAAASALAQPPAPRQTDLGGPIRTESIVRLADQLRLLQDAERDPRFRDALQAIRQSNPNISADQLQLARELLRQHPELLDQGKLQELARGIGGSGMPDGLPGFDLKKLPDMPPMPPPRVSPVPRGPALPHEAQSSRNGEPPGAMPDRPGGGREGGEFPGRGFFPKEWEGQPPPFAPPPFDDRMNPEQLARRQQQLAAVTRWWEQNVGPLRKTPAVREFLRDVMLGDSKSATGTETLGDLVDAASRGDGPELRGVLKELGVSDWKFPDLGLGGGKRRRGNHLDWVPAAPGAASPSWPRVGSMGDSWLPVILFGLIAAGALVLWWLWPKLTAAREDGPRPLPGLGPWPVDPRRVTDRDALVRAFEYLSVLLCGQGVRTWNHVTIAAALERAVPRADALAEPLAKLYALARYTPADEPLPPAAIAEAREYLCELAGVPAA